MKRRLALIIMSVLMVQQTIPTLAVEHVHELNDSVYGTITLGDHTVSYSGDDNDIAISVSSDHTNVTICNDGTYHVAGTGVNTTITTEIETKFILDSGLTVHNSSTQPVIQTSDEPVTIEVAGSTNITQTGKSPIISAASDLTLTGSSALTLTPSSKPAFEILSNSDLTFNGPTVTIEDAPGDAIKAKECNVTLHAGTLNASCSKGKAIDAKGGTVTVEGGQLNALLCEDDCIVAEDYEQSGGTVTLSTTYDKSDVAYWVNSSPGSNASTSVNYIYKNGDKKYEVFNVDTGSHAGLKVGTKQKDVYYSNGANSTSQNASGLVYISGGTLTIDTTATGLKTYKLTDGTAKHPDGSGYTNNTQTTDTPYIIGAPDDGIKGQAEVKITGGTTSIDSSDDGIQAGTKVSVTGGTLNINQCYEGIESPSITFGKTGSTTSNVTTITSLDDSLNASGKTNTYTYSNTDEDVPYTKVTTSKGNNTINILGGTTKVNVINETKSRTLGNTTFKFNSIGDAVDANGSITVSGGKIEAYNNSAESEALFDNDNGFTFNGGTFFGAGYSGMGNETLPTTTSVPYLYANINFSAGNTITIKKSTTTIATFAAPCSGSFIEYGSSSLESGTTYTITAGANSTTATATTESHTTPSGPGGGGGGGGHDTPPVNPDDPSTPSANYTVTNATTDSNIASVTITPTTATAGTKVKVYATAKDGYAVDKVTIAYSGTTRTITNNSTFTMPSANVTVTVTAVSTATTPEAYLIHNSTIDPGIANVAITKNSKSVSCATPGSTIKVTVTPCAGRTLRDISVIPSTGTPSNIRNEGTFTMPECSVTVVSRAVPVEEEDDEPSGNQIVTEYYTIDANGNTHFKKTGVILYANGDLYVPGYLLQKVDDAHITDDGSILYANGLKLSLDQSVTLPNGDILYVDGTKKQAEPSTPTPTTDKYIVNSDRSVTCPDGSVIPSSSITHNSDGTLTLPNGIRINSDGTLYVEPTKEQTPSQNKTISANLPEGYSITYTRQVSYNGKKHVATTMKETKSKSADIEITIKSPDGSVLNPSQYKVKFKDNKKVNSKRGARFYIKLKGVSGAVKKAVRKEACQFTIAPISIEGEVLEAERCEKKGNRFVIKKVSIKGQDGNLKYRKKKNKSCDITGAKWANNAHTAVSVNGVNNVTGTGIIYLTK